jgi:hypothetical protein
MTRNLFSEPQDTPHLLTRAGVDGQHLRNGALSGSIFALEQDTRHHRQHQYHGKQD